MRLSADYAVEGRSDAAGVAYDSEDLNEALQKTVYVREGVRGELDEQARNVSEAASGQGAEVRPVQGKIDYSVGPLGMDDPATLERMGVLAEGRADTLFVVSGMPDALIVSQRMEEGISWNSYDPATTKEIPGTRSGDPLTTVKAAETAIKDRPARTATLAEQARDAASGQNAPTTARGPAAAPTPAEQAVSRGNGQGR